MLKNKFRKSFKQKESLGEVDSSRAATILSRELGHNRYRRIKNFSFSKGDEYWEKTKAYFKPRGVRSTHTAGYAPNANPRAESAVYVIQSRARVLMMSLGPEAKTLWPAAVQHACWTTRRGAKRPRALVPAFGEVVAAKLKHNPSDALEPRARARRRENALFSVYSLARQPS